MGKATRLQVWNDRDRAKARLWVDRMPRGWTLWFKPPTRSNPQNELMWAMLDEIAEQKEHDGKKRSSDAWKDLFTACLAGQEIVSGLEGGIVALGKRTSEMGIEEMGDLLMLIEAWGAQNGVVFKDKKSAAGGHDTAEEPRAAEQPGANGASAARKLSRSAP